jgi:hypothetical protein
MPTPGVSGADVPFPSSEAFIFASFIPFDGMAALRALSATIRPDPRGLRNLRDYPDHVQQNKPQSRSKQFRCSKFGINFQSLTGILN